MTYGVGRLPRGSAPPRHAPCGLTTRAWHAPPGERSGAQARLAPVHRSQNRHPARPGPLGGPHDRRYDAAARATAAQTVHMFTPFFKVFSLLDAREKSRGLGVFALIVVRGVAEVVGIASVTPFIAVASNPGLIHSNRWLRAAFELGGFASPRSFMIALCLG